MNINLALLFLGVALLTVLLVGMNIHLTKIQKKEVETIPTSRITKNRSILAHLRLLELPKQFAARLYGNQPILTYSIKGVHVLIFDLDGKIYIGCPTETLMGMLEANRFEQLLTYIPLCGPNEIYRGKMKTYKGIEYEIYPSFLNEGDTSEDAEIALMWETYHRLRTEYKEQLSR